MGLSPQSTIQQPRERAVPCSRCMRPTWNNNAVCGVCTDLERIADRLDANEVHVDERDEVG